MFFPRYLGGWGWGWPMLVGSLLFWALMIVLIVLLIRYLTRGGGQWTGSGWRPPGQPGHYPGGGPGGYPQPGPFPPGPGGPENLLAERFARGEIDEQEFRHRMEVLRAEARAHAQPPGPPPPVPGPPPSAPPPAPGA